MTLPYPGELCALGAAVSWAFALVLFKQSGESVRPIPLNVFKNAVALLLLGATLLIDSDHRPADVDYWGRDVQVLLLSGILGIAVADTLFFIGLNRIGVSLTAIVECAYSPCILFFSWWLLDEQLGLPALLGMAMILGGVLLASGTSSSAQPRPRGQILLGLACGLAAMVSMGYGIVLAKPVLERYPTVWSTTIRLLGGMVALALIGALLPERKGLLTVFRPSRIWVRSIPGSFLGTYVALLFWIAGFKYAEATVAAALNQTASIFSVLLAALFLREPLTRPKVLATVLALAGVYLMLFTRPGQREATPDPAGPAVSMGVPSRALEAGSWLGSDDQPSAAASNAPESKS